MSNIDKQQENGVVRIVHGRSCKGCTLCCKVLAISDLEKPRATWCRHCDPKIGCEIHGMHPAECKEFYCGYLTNAALDERWAPTKSKLVLAYDELHAPRLSVHVDPRRPGPTERLARGALLLADQALGRRGARAGDRVAGAEHHCRAAGPRQRPRRGAPRSVQYYVAKAASQGTTLDMFVVDRDHPIARSLQDVRR